VLTHFALDLGFSVFILAAESDPRPLTSFVEQVAPKVHERVADRRRTA
jgi:hypothetical protein